MDDGRAAFCQRLPKSALGLRSGFDGVARYAKRARQQRVVHLTAKIHLGKMQPGVFFCSWRTSPNAWLSKITSITGR